MTKRPVRIWDGTEWVDVSADPVVPPATSEQGALADTAVQPEDLGTAAYTDTTAYVAADDARLSDARTPTAHAASHASGGSDEIIGAVWSTTISAIWTGTQAEYDLLTPDANTLYIIVESP